MCRNNDWRVRYTYWTTHLHLTLCVQKHILFHQQVVPHKSLMHRNDINRYRIVCVWVQCLWQNNNHVLYSICQKYAEDLVVPKLFSFSHIARKLGFTWCIYLHYSGLLRRQWGDHMITNSTSELRKWVKSSFNITCQDKTNFVQTSRRMLYIPLHRP